MSRFRRHSRAPLLMLAMMLPSTPAAFPQPEPPPAAAATGASADTGAPIADPSTGAATTTYNSHDVRSDFSALLRKSPSELATIFVLDPTLLSNDAFLAGYPELARFVAAHPEVRRNPRYYLEEFAHADNDGDFGGILEPILIASVFGVIALAVAWLIRTLIEQRRWSRLSRTQSEVHNKILEKFGTSEALLEYMRSPAGSKFLESAPIPLRAEAAAPSAPIARVMGSIQLGVIVAAGAIGMLVVSGRLEKEAAEGFFALGVIGLCIGGGFIVSAVVSLALSRRLGLWQDPAVLGADHLDSAAGER